MNVIVHRIARRYMQRRVASLTTDYAGKAAAYVDKLYKEIVATVKRSSYATLDDVKSTADGVIWYWFDTYLHETGIAKTLWNIFEGPGGKSLATGSNTQDIAYKYARYVAGGVGAEGKLRAAAAAVLLLRKTRQPKVADRVEIILTKALASEMAQVVPVAEAAITSPSEVFDQQIVKMNPIASKLVKQVKALSGGDPGAYTAFVFDVAEDINWHDIPVGSNWDTTPENQEAWNNLISKTSYSMNWRFDDSAVLFVAFLLKVGDTANAKVVKREAIKNFSESYVEDAA